MEYLCNGMFYSSENNLFTATYNKKDGALECNVNQMRPSSQRDCNVAIHVTNEETQLVYAIRGQDGSYPGV